MSTLLEIKKQYKTNCIAGGNEGTKKWWAFIETQNSEDILSVVAQQREVQDRLKKYKNSFYYKNKIRKFVSEHLHTDVHAYEVVKVCTAKKVLIRRLDAKCVKTPSQFSPGGFSGHYADNHDQRWEFSSNEENRLEELRLGKKGWGNGKFSMRDTPYEHYDYNF